MYCLIARAYEYRCAKTEKDMPTQELSGSFDCRAHAYRAGKWNYVTGKASISLSGPASLNTTATGTVST